MLDIRIIQKTLRVPETAAPEGDGRAVARQLDAALLNAGFKASGELLDHLSRLDAGVVMDTGVRVLAAVREIVGDHLQHNVYFRDFPANVPDTVEFWVRCLREAIVRSGGPGDEAHGDAVLRAVLSTGQVNLLALPSYGRYQHTYAELLAAHDELIPSVKDRLTVIHLGRPLSEEIRHLYLSLAGSPAPLGDADLALLGELATECVDGEQPATIPSRENRAVINRARLLADRLLLVDTVTDVLRLACALSDGDVSLTTPTRFRSFPRARRRTLLTALDAVVCDAPAKAADAARHREMWKRLGERLHPHEYPHLPHALDVFAVAHGDKTVRSLAARVELAFSGGQVSDAVSLLATAPGMLFRSLDRVLRAATPDEVDRTLGAAREVIGRVSGRVILGVREHLADRTTPDAWRIFVNREARAWARVDDRPPLAEPVVRRLTEILDAELARRLPSWDRVVVDPAVLDLTVPLTGRTAPNGFGVVPRGSVVPVDGEALRFFVYWRQAHESTDFDLSVLLLDDEFVPTGHVSWTNLQAYGGVHSGDITDAETGASEFIDLDLGRVRARYVLPQVHVYSGEGFGKVAESFFGFMLRGPDQAGRPFEPRTVRMKSDLRGSGRVALPAVFARDDDGRWSAHWMHLYLRGTDWANRVETNRVSTTLLARGVLERRYLPMSYLVDLLAAKAGATTPYEAGMELDGPVAFIGLERPEGLPAGSEVYALDRLNELIPE
ncbi:TerD family protein [Actinoallomurus purpureus]|uniref:TerD family protein n=1 Tax=Actinoallomurus purpureus TaxID=478114 RepID=UPI002092939B|nr:TerD family protein [Actinoallomurus purpureus]MCO6003402.1 TerD family protein [Actinoallomurus purpureus]